MTEPKTFHGLLCFGDVPSVEHPPEIHLNLWETDAWAFMDIGLKISRSSPLKKVTLLLPWESSSEARITDLFAEGALNTPAAISAIFNEAWSVTLLPAGEALVQDNEGNDQFAIVSSAPYITTSAQKDTPPRSLCLTLDIEQIRTKEVENSAIPKACDEYYVRFRVLGVPKSFYSRGLDQEDTMLLSSWQATDILEFRLNVRRGVDASLVKKFGFLLCFSKVHLFLMRDRDYDITFQDATFKGCRSLENEEFWTVYSSKGLSAGELASRSKSKVKESLGYHWSKRKNDTGFVDEFSVLARFKKTKYGLISFLFVALLLGALGNGLWDAIQEIPTFVRYVMAATKGA
jgi:hypothetical protein